MRAMLRLIKTKVKSFVDRQRKPSHVVLWEDLLKLHGQLSASDKGTQSKSLVAAPPKLVAKAKRVGGISGLFLEFVSGRLDHARGQLCQDLMVLFFLGEERDGFFVEFGATDGKYLSNTFLLENRYGWKGNLAEPAPVWQANLAKNRSAEVDHRCVWTKSGEMLTFSQTEYAELSTISSFASSDFHATSRAVDDTFQVRTISLNDLLAEHHAPREIDYLSVDTEGSELDILSAFEFSRHVIKVITVEHNYHPTKRNQLLKLLTAEGYRRVLQDFSAFDDWYVRCEILDAKNRMLQY